MTVTTSKRNSEMAESLEKETRLITVKGIRCTIEKRICQGGCKKEFWVFPNSTAEHARSDCRFVCNVPIDDIPEHIMRRYDQYTERERETFEMEKQAYSRQLFSKTNPKTKPPKQAKEKPKPLLKENDPAFIRQQRRWETAIARARKILQRKSAFPMFRESVAAIASSVVTNKKNFSIKCFSALVGLDRKTLQGWIHVKREVVDRISVYNGNFLAARRTRDVLKENPLVDMDLNSLFIQESLKCQEEPKRKKRKNKSNGLSTISPSGKIKAYRTKIKVKYVS